MDGLLEEKDESFSLVAGFNIMNSVFIDKLQKMKEKEESYHASAEARLRLLSLQEKRHDN